MSVIDDIFKAMLADPLYAPVAQILQPSLPALAKMGSDRGILTLQSLISPDPTYGLEQLRSNLTDAEWTVIAAAYAAEGNAIVLKEINVRDFLVGLLLSVLLAAAKAIPI